MPQRSPGFKCRRLTCLDQSPIISLKGFRVGNPYPFAPVSPRRELPFGDSPRAPKEQDLCMMKRDLSKIFHPYMDREAKNRKDP